MNEFIRKHLPEFCCLGGALLAVINVHAEPVSKRPVIQNSAACTPGPSDYPAESLSRGEQGRTIVELDVDKHGALLAANVLRSSGFRRLDNAALKKLALCKFSAATDEAGLPKQATLHVEYVWRVPGMPTNTENDNKKTKP